MSGERSSKPWFKPVMLALLVAVCLVLVAVTMPKSFPFLRGESTGEVDLGDAATLVDYLLIAAGVVVLFFGLFLRVRLVGGPGGRRAKRRPVWAQLMSFAAIMLVVWAVVELREDGRFFGDRPDRGVSEGRGDAGGDGSGPTAVGLLVTAALTTGAVAAAAGIYLLRKRAPRYDAPPATAAEELATLIGEGLAALERDADPRSVVIGCYRSMGEMLERAGTPRFASDTPFEFIERALLRFDVDPESAARLTTMFEHARFSPHETTEGMRVDAIAALEDVKDQLKVTRGPIS